MPLPLRLVYGFLYHDLVFLSLKRICSEYRIEIPETLTRFKCKTSFFGVRI